MAIVTDIFPRHPFTVLPDTDMWELNDGQQREVYKAVGSLLMSMVEHTGEPYLRDFVVTLEGGDHVAFECEIWVDCIANRN